MGWPARICAMTFFCPGMIQKNTLALIAVANIAPVIRKAARPANNWQAAQAAATTYTSTSAPTRPSPPTLPSFSPTQRQIRSYTTQNTARKASAAATAAAGDQSYTFLSIRKLLALNRYSVMNKPMPVSQVE